MTVDEDQIRTMIEWWAAAVHAGDMDGVLADHAADIVMFDVPPPEDGVRGLDAYRDTWPEFFRWQADGAVFEIARWRSPPATMSRSPTRCCAVAPPRSWPSIRTGGCGSRWGCARNTAAGWSRTSTTPSPTPPRRLPKPRCARCTSGDLTPPPATISTARARLVRHRRHCPHVPIPVSDLVVQRIRRNRRPGKQTPQQRENSGDTSARHGPTPESREATLDRIRLRRSE